MRRKLKVGFVGAGNRMRKYYMPVFSALDFVDVVGFSTRSSSTADAASAETGLKRHTVAELKELADVIIVCIPAAAITSTALSLIEAIGTDAHLIIETPIESEILARESWNHAKIGHMICAAENWPYRPMNVHVCEMIDSGIFGHINAIINDFRGYEYHAIAMMRQLAGDAMPAAAMGMTWNSGPVDFIDGSGTKKQLHEVWDVGVIDLENGVKLVHNFNSIHSRSGARGSRSLRVMGKLGSVSFDDRNVHDAVTLVDGIATPFTIDVSSSEVIVSDVKFGRGQHARIETPTVSGAGGLDDQQQSTARMIHEFGRIICDDESGDPYWAWQSWHDYVCVHALRQSSQRGQRIYFTPRTWMV